MKSPVCEGEWFLFRPFFRGSATHICLSYLEAGVLIESEPEQTRGEAHAGSQVDNMLRGIVTSGCLGAFGNPGLAPFACQCFMCDDVGHACVLQSSIRFHSHDGVVCLNCPPSWRG